MKKLLRVLILAAVVAILAAAGFFAWLMHDFHEGGKTDYWNTDAPPDAAWKARFTEWGYPDTISRMVRVGSSSRWNGDGRNLTIYHFPVESVEQMKNALGENSTWEDGLPAENAWKDQVRELAPKEFSSDDFSDSSAFIHLQSPPGSLRWTIIDIHRGVSYQITIRT